MATTNLGRVAIVAQGEYNPTTQYEKLDIVRYVGASYLVLRAVKGVVPTDGADYSLLAGRGESAYEVAVDNGYVGTEQDWLAYIRADGSIQALQQFMTNDASTEVAVPAYGNIPSLQGYISTMFESGGLPATPFATKALMEASALVDGDYAQVTDDTTNNGLYVKTAGSWIKSTYDPVKQSKEYVDNLATVNYKVVSEPTDLDTVLKAGIYLTSTGAYATPELNYPPTGASTGFLEVVETYGTSAIYQKYRTATGRLFTRFFNAYSWSQWKEIGKEVTKDSLAPLLTDYAQVATSLSVRGSITEDDNLNDFKKMGVWHANITFANWRDLNYPARAAGILQVFSSTYTSQVYQLFITANNIYVRYMDSVNPWTAWKPFADGGVYKVHATIATQDLNDLKELGVYLKNSGTTGTPELNYPTKDIGVLKVYAGSAVTSLIIQEYVSRYGSVYIRYFNNVSWSDWVANNPSIASTGGSDSIAFRKAAKGLDFYNKSVNGDNSIQIGLTRSTNEDVQRDVWGITYCQEVDAAGSIVKPITSGGVWETAIAAADNISDHSGGGHGDEILQSAYFMVDGVYYPQDFVGEGAAKEIKFYQKSTLYIEAKTDILCYKEIVWTFDSKGLNLKQKLTFPRAIVLNTSWIAMLPVLRKTNQDNTGDRVTDIEIRSQDGIAIDVSEPTFARRNLDIGDGDSISLSSAESGIGAELIINTIKASDNPQAFVQNTDPYNKIYVQGAPIVGTYTTSIDEEWYIDADFKVTTKN